MNSRNPSVIGRDELNESKLSKSSSQLSFLNETQSSRSKKIAKPSNLANYKSAAVGARPVAKKISRTSSTLGHPTMSMLQK